MNLEEARVTSISQYPDKVQKLFGNLKNLPTTMFERYKDFAQAEAEALRRAEKLGVPMMLRLNNSQLENSITTTAENMQVIRRRVGEMKIDDSSSMEDVEHAESELKKFDQFLLNSHRRTFDTPELITEYRDEVEFQLKKGIDERVQGAIKHAKLSLLKRRQKEVSERKIGFFGRLRGLDKVKELELQNIELELAAENVRPIIPKKEYSVHDSLADLVAFSRSDLAGQMTEEMQNVYNSVVYTDVFGVNAKQINNYYYRTEESQNLSIGIKSKAISKFSDLMHSIAKDTILPDAREGEYEYTTNNRQAISELEQNHNQRKKAKAQEEKCNTLDLFGM